MKSLAREQAPLPRRLDKFLADTRLGSRQHIEALGASGAIHLNGLETRQLRKLVDPQRDVVEVDGKQAKLSPPRVYALLHKPAGIVTTLSDPTGQPCITGLIPEAWHGLVGVVGRLDKPTTGALLVTDDGNLSHLLTGPAYHVWKRYVLTVRGELLDSDPRLVQLREGVMLGERETRPAHCGVVPDSVRPEGYNQCVCDVWVEIHEGRFRQVRRMARQVRLKLVHLHRSAIGPLKLADLAEGQWRALTIAEVDALYEAAGGRERARAETRQRLKRRLGDGELDAEDATLARRYFAGCSE